MATVLEVDEKGTTTNCVDCGHPSKKRLDQRIWVCPACGVKHHRDFSAARAIARRAKEMVVTTELSPGRRKVILK